MAVYLYSQDSHGLNVTKHVKIIEKMVEPWNLQKKFNLWLSCKYHLGMYN